MPTVMVIVIAIVIMQLSLTRQTRLRKAAVEGRLAQRPSWGLRDDKLAKVGFRKIGVRLMLCICGDAVCGGWFLVGDRSYRRVRFASFGFG